MRYLVIVEQTATGYSAYSPDLEGCVAAGRSRDEVENEMRGAIAIHIEHLRQHGYSVPAPGSYSTYVEVPA